MSFVRGRADRDIEVDKWINWWKGCKRFNANASTVYYYLICCTYEAINTHTHTVACVAITMYASNSAKQQCCRSKMLRTTGRTRLPTAWREKQEQKGAELQKNLCWRIFINFHSLCKQSVIINIMHGQFMFHMRCTHPKSSLN